MDILDFEVYCEANGNFMQSARWASHKSRWDSEFITAEDQNGAVVGTMLVLIKKIPIINKTLLYVPHGPVCDMHNPEVLRAMFSKLTETAKNHRGYAVKMDPLIDENDVQAIENLKALGFTHHPERVGYDTVQCRENYVLDIGGRSKDEIFRSFKSKWRYNIRLSQRKGVTCGFYGEEKLDDFMELMRETAKRDGFKMRKKEYFQSFLSCFSGKAKLCMCYLGDFPLSGALCVDYAGTMSYVYGCSSNRLRNYMPNYLMQWTMIQQACDNGDRQYDFCGIPYWYDEAHPNYGVYQFKQGFNGYVKTYAGEFDYCIMPFINFLSNLANKIRKKL